MTFNQENGTDSCKGGNRVTTLFLWKLSPCFREIIKRLFYITSLQSWLKESEKQDLVLWVCQRRKYNYSIVTILSTEEFNLCVWNKNIFFQNINENIFKSSFLDFVSTQRGSNSHSKISVIRFPSQNGSARTFLPPLSLLHEKLLPFLPTLVQQPMPKQCSS